MARRVFISYAQVPEDHKQRVADLAATLRDSGLDVVFDRDVTSPQGPPEGWPKWMLDQIELADWVLVVCNEAYYRRFRGREVPGLGLGARWEGAVIGQALYSDGTVNQKFVPVLLGDDQAVHIPEPLRGATYYRLPAETPKLAAALAEGAVAHPTTGVGMARPGGAPRSRWSVSALGGLLASLMLVGFVLWRTAGLGGSRPPVEASTFPLTTFVHGEAGPQELVLRDEGSLLLDLGTDRRREKIGDKGQAVFSEIPASFRGQTVNVALEAEGYELVDPRPRRLDGNELYLSVRKSSARFIGRVQDEDGNPVAGATIEVAGLSTETQSTGRFEFVVPGDHLQPDLILHAQAKGYVPWSGHIEPGGGEMTVPLQRH
jgi:hypothetical protein